ncbi:MFS transporter [Salipiger bermudensis]|nr:MFS transporter [Salipiger bermudensis]
MLPTRRSVIAGAASTVLLPAVARAESGTGAMRLRISFDDQQVIYQLVNNPTVRDLISMLPTELEIQDFSNNEKIVHLPRRLDEGGFEAFEDETPGDLCYFLGWGNLALFHDDYTFRDDLIRLGHIEGSVAPLLHKGTYPVRIETV